ncbi:MAG TPA: hypothetical protein VK934_01195 [Fimbriimonas sp.]|nr:hypothetical protein [Fimbriimonas sp.]
MEGIRPSGAKWLIGTVVVSALIVASLLSAQIVKGRRIEADIGRELDALAHLGIELRKTTSAQEAGDRFRDIANKISRHDEEPAILAAITDATSKPPLTIDVDVTGRVWASTDNISTWLNHRAVEAAIANDKERFNALYDASETLLAYVKASVGTQLPLHTAFPKAGTGQLWLRERLVAGDLPHCSRSRLITAGQMIMLPEAFEKRYGGPSASGASTLANVVERMATKQPSNRERKLICLRLLRNIAESLATMSTKAALLRDVNQEMADAFNAQSLTYPIPNFGSPSGFNYKDVHVALIQMDIVNQRAAGKALRPSWSKPFCVDPLTGSAILVRATPTTLTLNASTWSIESTY